MQRVWRFSKPHAPPPEFTGIIWSASQFSSNAPQFRQWPWSIAYNLLLITEVFPWIIAYERYAASLHSRDAHRVCWPESLVPQPQEHVPSFGVGYMWIILKSFWYLENLSIIIVSLENVLNESKTNIVDNSWVRKIWKSYAHPDDLLTDKVISYDKDTCISFSKSSFWFK